MRKRLVILGLLLIVPACGERTDRPANNRAGVKLAVFTDANFAKGVLESQQPVLIDFWGKG